MQLNSPGGYFACQMQPNDATSSRYAMSMHAQSFENGFPRCGDCRHMYLRVSGEGVRPPFGLAVFFSAIPYHPIPSSRTGPSIETITFYHCIRRRFAPTDGRSSWTSSKPRSYQYLMSSLPQECFHRSFSFVLGNWSE